MFVWAAFTLSQQSDLDQDELLRGRPIVLTRVDGHATWVSPKVLELTDLSKDVKGGEIVKDGAGQPTGGQIGSSSNSRSPSIRYTH